MYALYRAYEWGCVYAGALGDEGESEGVARGLREGGGSCDAVKIGCW